MNLKFASIAGFCVAVLALMLLIMRDSILGVGFVAIIVQVLSVPAYALGTLYIRSSQFSCNSESHRRWSNNLWPISLSSTSYLCRCDIFSLGRNIKSCIIVECTSRSHCNNRIIYSHLCRGASRDLTVSKLCRVCCTHQTNNSVCILIQIFLSCYGRLTSSSIRL